MSSSGDVPLKVLRAVKLGEMPQAMYFRKSESE